MFVWKGSKTLLFVIGRREGGDCPGDVSFEGQKEECSLRGGVHS